MSVTVITCQSGQTRLVKYAVSDDTPVLGLDEDNRVVVNVYGHRFGLTLCCDAFDKGSDGGVCCRACYGPDAGVYDAVVSDPMVKVEVLAMNTAQEAALRGLSDRYHVTFNAADFKPAFDLPDGWVAGWIGGTEYQALYVGCSPEGGISS